MTTLDKIIHKYPDLVIFSFEILRKEHKKPGSANWLKKKKKIILITIIPMGSVWPKFFVSQL